MTTFVMTAKFVIASIWSAQKSADRVIFFIDIPMFSSGNIRFCEFLEVPHRGDSNKYTKRVIYNRNNCSSFFITANLILQQNLW